MTPTEIRDRQALAEAHQVRWGLNKEARALVGAIVQRAVREGLLPAENQRMLNLTMDLEACHLNAVPLRLNELLHADRFNFTHDIIGISRHLNRETAQLENCFLPRFCVPARDRKAAHA